MSIYLSTNNYLTIQLDAHLALKGFATILTASGEVVKAIPLQQLSTVIDVTEFVNKNYSIKITQGTNVIVQKI